MHGQGDFSRRLPTPIPFAIGWSRSSPDSSGRSSPSREGNSLNSTSGHSTATSVVGETGTGEYEQRPREISSGLCEAESSEAPRQSGDRDDDRFLADMIKEMSTVEDDSIIVQEALTTCRKQRGLPIPDKPTAEKLPDNYTDPQIESFQKCLNAAQTFVEPPPKKVQQNRVDRLAGIMMKMRTKHRNSGFADSVISDQNQAQIRHEANQISLPERLDVPKALIDKIGHAETEKRRRQDHRISLGYGGQLVPLFILHFADPPTDYKTGGKKGKKGKKPERGKEHEKAVVLSAIVLWNVLLARAIEKLEQQNQQQQRYIALLRQQLSDLQPDRNKTPRYATHGQLSPIAPDTPDLSTLTLPPLANSDFPFRSLTNSVNYSVSTLKRGRDPEL